MSNFIEKRPRLRLTLPKGRAVISGQKMDVTARVVDGQPRESSKKQVVELQQPVRLFSFFLSSENVSGATLDRQSALDVRGRLMATSQPSQLLLMATRAAGNVSLSRPIRVHCR